MWERRGEIERALADLAKAIELDPDDYESYVTRAELWVEQEEWGNAAEDYTKAIEFYNEGFHITYHLERAKAWREFGEYDKAIAGCSTILDRYPKYEKALMERGWARLMKREYNLVVADTTKAVELDSQNYDAYYLRLAALERQKKFDDALHDANMLVQLDDKSGLSYVQRGELFVEMGRHDDAMADFNRAIEVDSEWGVAYYYRGWAWFERRIYSAAVVDLSKAIELGDEAERVYYLRGQAFRKLGQYERSIEDFTRVIVIDPADRMAYRRRGEAELRCGKCREAVADLSKSIDLGLSSAYLFCLRGEAFKQAGELEKAIGDWTKALELDPDHQRSIEQRALAYFECGRYAESWEDVRSLWGRGLKVSQELVRGLLAEQSRAER